MLDFYETLDVTVGVTIDHLVLGSGKDKGRLYFDERAFDGELNKGDIPDPITDVVDVMIEEWPEEWPSYVDEYEPTIRTDPDIEVEPFIAEDLRGDIDTVLSRLAQDSRAVYREHDAEFRYDLTLRNAREMYDLYQRRDYPFRLMVAIQGWDPDSYSKATEEVLGMGYDYLGIGESQVAQFTTFVESSRASGRRSSSSNENTTPASTLTSSVSRRLRRSRRLVGRG